MDATFRIGFEGALIECDSLKDAVCLKCANEILADPDPADVSHARLRDLVDVLSRYSQFDAADRMRCMAAKARAVALLTATRGYVRPKRRSPELAGSSPFLLTRPPV